MPSRTDASMVTAFTEVITTPKTGGYHPALNVMDNECSATVKKYIRSEKINIQLVLPHNHRVNAAERAVTTFKEHFIAALATVDMHCPLQLWVKFLPQVELTLNMLRFSHRNPNKSANQEVYGSFDFNKTPLAPLGTKALTYDPSITCILGPPCNQWVLCRPGFQSLPLPPILHPGHTVLPVLRHLASVSSPQPDPCNFTT
jgi:hypothetical protein